MIQLKNITVEFGDKTLFNDVTMSFADNNNYGIVGANGAGKSTLLKVMSGEMHPTQGTVEVPASQTLSFLRQNQFEFEEEKIIDVVLMGKEQLWELNQEREQLSGKTTLSVDEGHRLAQIENKLHQLNGYKAEAKAAIILKGLGFSTAQHTHKMATLSGGYKLRVLLAQCLYSEPDILLLDEPNNHLDINSINWLGNYLKEYAGIVLLVSHDHHFINQVSDFIIDIDYETLKSYPGNYEHFLRAKALEIERKEKEIEKQEKRKEEMQRFVERFQAKATKARQANSRKKQIEKMEEIHIPKSSRRAPFFRFNEARPSGTQVLEAFGICKRFGGNEVLNQIDLNINRGDKVAIIGPNGIGKTTLLKIIMNELNFNAGEYKWGENIQFGYFAQNHKEQMPVDEKVYGWLQSHFPGESVGTVRKSLGRMLFDNEDVEKLTGTLSGGETARLIFSKLTMLQTNVLILDEPTNHLDLESIEALANALNQYHGTIIFVSHDRYFIDQVADTILEITPKGYNRHLGTYTEFLEKFGEDYLDRTANVRVKKSDTKKQVSKSDKKILNQERRTLVKECAKLENREEKLENKILEFEDQIEEIDTKLNSVEIYQDQKKLENAYQDKQKLESQLEKTMANWEKEQEAIEKMTNRIKAIDEKIKEA